MTPRHSLDKPQEMNHLNDQSKLDDHSSANANQQSTSSEQAVSLPPPPLQFQMSSPFEDKADEKETSSLTQLQTANGEYPDDGAKTSGSENNNTGLPAQLKSGMEGLSGFSLDDVNVHYNSDKPAQLQAHAYAQGSDIHLGPGQEKHLPHEAWHVVQQKQGRVRPTAQLKAFNINDDVGLEKEADEMGNKAMQLKKSTVSSELKRSSSFANVIQQRNWKKTLANVASLGIRKLVVHIQRQRAQAAAAHVPPAAPADPEDEFMDAYEKSRYYHHTLHPTNLESIEEHGLLNYEDQPKILGDHVAGMSNLGGEFEGDEKKGIFLGPDRRWMTEGESTGMTRNVVRAFLPKGRTKRHNTPDGTDVPSQELYRDGKFPGAFITKDSIFGDQVTGGNLLEMLNESDPKIDSILTTVASHYEGSAPSLDQLKVHMESVIRKRRLSNAPLHDIEGELMKEDAIPNDE